MHKKAQVATGMTWFVATIIIILILGVSIYVSSIGEIFGRGFDFSKSADLFVTKSTSAYLLSSCDEGNIFNLINNKKDITRCEGEKAEKVFLNIYSNKEEVLGVAGLFIGISDENVLYLVKSNYFGENTVKPNSVSFYFEKFQLNEEDFLYIFGAKGK